MGTLPIERPAKIIAVGLNYRDHAREAGLPLPARPVSFTKWPSCLIGPGEPIRIPGSSAEVDFEAELAVVIGETARNIAAAQALDVVRGYLCLNDVSARDIQFAEGQWSRAKSLDTFGPIGPHLVPAADIPDPQRLAVTTRLNGEVVQESNTAEMVFPVAELISYLSQDMTLEPGDLIATGTPAGVGAFHRPPRFLRAGDVISVEIERIGVLSNPVVAAD